jgi:thymidine phosphorylase
VTATVESVPLITASILSKKLAAGLQGSLVMDVKLGNGAFMPTWPAAARWRRSLVDVAAGAGLPCRALITDMNQVLGTTAGNALEVQESIHFLTGAAQEPRLLALTLALAAADAALALAWPPAWPTAPPAPAAALHSGRAAEHFARMVAGLGGPTDVLAAPGLPTAPVQLDVPAPRPGVLAATDTRALGLAVVAAGRRAARGQRRHRPARRLQPGAAARCAGGGR